MKTFLGFVILLNLLAALGIYYFVPAKTAVETVLAMSELAELEHSGAIDAAKLSHYNPRRYPTTAAAEEAIDREHVYEAIFLPVVEASRSARWIAIVVACANALAAGIALAAMSRVTDGQKQVQSDA